jgi:hypothetical protein
MGNQPYRNNHVRITMLAVLIFSGTLLVGCKSQELIGNRITVEGMATMRGNVPFNEVILETGSRNYYALQLTSEQQALLITPSRLRVTGQVKRGEWNGRPYTFLQVIAFQRID